MIMIKMTIMMRTHLSFPHFSGSHFLVLDKTVLAVNLRSHLFHISCQPLLCSAQLKDNTHKNFTTSAATFIVSFSSPPNSKSSSWMWSLSFNFKTHRRLLWLQNPRKQSLQSKLLQIKSQSMGSCLGRSMYTCEHQQCVNMVPQPKSGSNSKRVAM